ncbi:MAG: hypothetical protein Q4P32_07060, partial [Micrococcales bacterium]|nr:hypothetical protein [Micrococcales bacterium]
MGKLLSAMRKAGWNLGDQILSAASNVILSIVIARTVDKYVFGAFAIAFVVFGVGIALARSIVGQPLQIRYAAAPPAEQHAAIGRAHGLAVVLGIALGVLSALAATMLSGALAEALFALSVCLPGLLLQDSQRLTFFAIGKAWGAVVIDTVWTVVQLGALAILITSGHSAISELILAWGASAALAVLVGAVILQVVPRLGAWLAWLREIKDLVRYLLAEYILGLGASQIAVLLVGVIAAPQAVGAIRAAQTLLGPLNILGGACFNFTVPEIARRTHLTASQRLLAGHAVSGLMGAATVTYVVALLLIPDWMGQEIFSDSWAGAAGVLLPLGISALFSSLANGLAGVLYGLGRADRTFRINLYKAPVIVIAVLGGTWLGGAVGAGWGMAIAEAFVLPFWYREFRAAALRTALPQPEQTAPEPD